MRAAIVRWTGLVLAGALLLATPPPAIAQVIVAGSTLTPDKDLTPEEEQRLLAEYWNVARRYKSDPSKTVTELTAWTRDRIGKVQSIQFQPETAPRPDYMQGKAEWNPDTLRMAAILHSDLALNAFARRNIQEFEFQAGIAEGWFILADNKQSAPGSLRSRWTVSLARFLLASGEVGIAERILNRAAERIGGDAAILLAQGTVKETQASRLVADLPGGRLDDPDLAVKSRTAALAAAESAFDRAIKLQPALLEAKLRLAHVYAMKRDDTRAQALANEVLAAKPPAPLQYLASLIVGGALERANQIDAAAKTYLNAILAVPDGQSAYLALAGIMHRSGQPADAAVVLERLFGRAITNATADPWWIYPLGLDLSMDAQFEEYRKLVRK